jgi:hypothetical protein
VQSVDGTKRVGSTRKLNHQRVLDRFVAVEDVASMRILRNDRITVIDMNAQPVECGMCEKDCWHEYSVPWYCGPVRESDCYRAVCPECYDEWLRAVEVI